jgi:hypothetical protein
MVNMRDSYQRDDVTLIEHLAPDATDAWNRFGSEPISAVTDLVPDETIVILDRLRDVTTRALHLEVRHNPRLGA